MVERWRFRAIFLAFLAGLVFFQGLHQQNRLMLLALRGDVEQAPISEVHRDWHGLYHWSAYCGQGWSLIPPGPTVAVSRYHGCWFKSCQTYEMIGDSRLRVWVLPLQVALLLGLSGYCRKRAEFRCLQTTNDKLRL